MEEVKQGQETGAFHLKQKDKSQFYDFLVTQGPNNQNKFFTNDYVGQAQAPIIGKYQRSTYELNQVQGLVACECLCQQDTKRVFSANQNSQDTQTELGLPPEVKDIIFNIPLKIKHNKNAADEAQSQNQKNYANQNKGGYQQKKQYTSKAPDFHPFTFSNALNINVVWEISFQNQNINLNFTENFLNLVCHPYVFQELNFESRKRIISNTPVCIVVPNRISKTAGVKELDDQFKGVLFNQIRSEYLSCHISGSGLMFSPNNMKFALLDKDVDLIHFYVVILSEMNFHHVFYVWNFMNGFKFKQEAQQMMKQSGNISQLVAGFSALLGEQHEAIQEIKQLFKIA